MLYRLTHLVLEKQSAFHMNSGVQLSLAELMFRKIGWKAYHE
jgi:hypothetical protein